MEIPMGTTIFCELHYEIETNWHIIGMWKIVWKTIETHNKNEENQTTKKNRG